MLTTNRIPRPAQAWAAVMIVALSLGSIMGAGLLWANSGRVTQAEWAKPAAAQFPLRISSSRRYLVDSADRPFLIRGDAAWSLIAQLTREEAVLYLEDRRRKGFNLLLVNLIEHHFADRPPANAYGDAPFLVGNDFRRPNEAYFSHADWILKQARERGFAVLLCPSYLGYEGNQEGWYEVMKRNGEVALAEYGRFVGERYRDYVNIIWLEGGDFTPPPEGLVLVDAIARAIRRAAPRHLQAAHWAPETSAADVPREWLDINTTYTYRPVYLKSLEDYARPNRRPHFLIESAYEEEWNSTPRSLRGQAYYALLTGAAGEIFGQRRVWKFQKGTIVNRLTNRWWQGSLDTDGTRGVEHARALFATLPWTELTPDVGNHVLVEGMGTHGGDLYALAAVTPDRRLVVAYVPSQRSIAIDANALALPARARWYDPTSGAFENALAKPIETPGIVPLATPNANQGGDQDWVLVIDTVDSR
jgi:hypothetical protein